MYITINLCFVVENFDQHNDADFAVQAQFYLHDCDTAQTKQFILIKKNLLIVKG
jgi:hypothetical protein